MEEMISSAKPLLYTVYRTRNRKRLGRKWSVKEISFQAVPKNSQRWSCGDVGRQTVPGGFQLPETRDRQ